MNFSGTIKLNPLGICVLLGLTFMLLLYTFGRNPLVKREINLKNLLIAAINIAEKGGEEIKVVSKSEFHKQSKGKTREGAFDFITDADIRSHCLMYYSLSLTFPHLKVSVLPTFSVNDYILLWIVNVIHQF